MAFDYFYGAQSQQFAFYRIPKVLFTDNRFQKISTEGKVLYGLLLDRVSLSMENGWIDDEGRVYIIFTLTTIRQAMNCAEKSAIKYLTELEEFGLIERIRQGFGKPALIYVKNFIDQQNLQVKTSKNYSSPPVKVTGQDLYNLQPNYTYNNNTDFNNTNPILSADEDRMGYEKYFMEQLNIEALKQDYPYDREMIDGIMELILDVVCSKRKIICIAGDVKSVNVVKGRFMKLNMEHIRYVMNCMQENTTKKLSGGDIKAVQGDSGHAQADMVTEVYGHILDEDRRKNAELMENAFYNKENLNPQMKAQDEGNSTITVPDGVDAELLMKVLGNPEMAALLTSLAKTMKV